MAATPTEPRLTAWWAGGPRSGAVVLAVTVLAACGAERPAVEAAGDASWSVTAWGDLYEVFPEVDPLVAGGVAVAHTHVTVLDGFAPLERGRVEIVLGGDGDEQVFAATESVRPGIFQVELRPDRAGERELRFRVSSPAGEEEIPGGRVRVGSDESPGGIAVAPAPRGATEAGEPVPFLKEEQWRSDMSTGWVRRGTFARAIEGQGRVRAPAGGETTLTAPLAAVLDTRGWPYPGLEVDAGAILFRLAPRVAVDRSLPALEAALAELEAELAAARARQGRLGELFALEAASTRELEEARTLVAALSARASAARSDLDTARAAREGVASHPIPLRAPFAGTVAEVTASPGATVEAGAPLARLVRTDLVWIEVLLSVDEARQLEQTPLAGVVLSFAEGSTLRIEEGVHLVAIAPSVDPATGLVAAYVEAPGAGLVRGATPGVRLLLDEQVEGIVVPASALIDDGGVPVVYLQLSGESFARQPVRVLAREGERVLVENLTPGQRLVTRGGEAIRRSSLLASGEAQGHVH
ncbi:MAG TPA: efflux RND transporter periplasmic adaptor subunit [Thermoanaerobaculia bacterium]|nr:efflux RND transporter periplasmic adaptor subunit [Thermoanaerobaculia bacterium]